MALCIHVLWFQKELRGYNLYTLNLYTALCIHICTHAIVTSQLYSTSLRLFQVLPLPPDQMFAVCSRQYITAGHRSLSETIFLRDWPFKWSFVWPFPPPPIADCTVATAMSAIRIGHHGQSNVTSDIDTLETWVHSY